MWQFRAAPNDWTIHEILVHITDSEANSYVRCRRFIAEPGSTVMGYDGMTWSKELHYHDRSTDDALELFRCLRACSYKLIKTLPDSVWAISVNHSESGRMTFDEWLEIYDNHIPEHVEQMQRVYHAWSKQKQTH